MLPKFFAFLLWIAFKTALKKGDKNALNIYSCLPSNGILGYAYFPTSTSGTNILDGMVLHYASLPGGSLTYYNLGDTATHEVGHFLGLYHTFQGGCASNSLTGGDMVADTPAVKQPNYGCPAATTDTCPTLTGLDDTSNFMDYTDDVCMNHFSAGQILRMQGQWDLYRALPVTTNTAVTTTVTTAITTTDTTADATTASAKTTTSLAWSNVQVGTVTAQTSSSNAYPRFNISGSGKLATTATDSFYYVYTQVSGDKTIITQVLSESLTTATAMAGVILREGLTPGRL